MKLVIQQPGATEIKVKLLLAGGHSAALVVPPDHPLLSQLLAAAADADGRMGAAHPGLFQIPVEGGRATLVFAAHQLLGVITDPGVVIQSDRPTEDQSASPKLSSAVAAAAAASAAQGHGELIRHPLVQLDGFLTGSEVAWLMEFVFSAKDSFAPSQVSDAKEDYRRSLVLGAPDVLKRLIIGKIRAVMPEVMSQLRVGRFPIGDIECQITASVDGSYFRAHTDAAANETEGRQFTYVYYFNREPKAFSGGELRIYDDTIRNGKLAATDSFQVVQPKHNSIVFFQAAVMHEVMPVKMPSGDFRDSRFTVNGWIDRA